MLQKQRALIANLLKHFKKKNWALLNQFRFISSLMKKKKHDLSRQNKMQFFVKIWLKKDTHKKKRRFILAMK